MASWRQRCILALLLATLCLALLPATSVASPTISNAPDGGEIVAAVLAWLPEQDTAGVTVEFVDTATLVRFLSPEHRALGSAAPCALAWIEQRRIMHDRAAPACLSRLAPNLVHEVGHFQPACLALAHAGQLQSSEDCAETYRRAKGF